MRNGLLQIPTAIAWQPARVWARFRLCRGPDLNRRHMVLQTIALPYPRFPRDDVRDAQWSAVTRNGLLRNGLRTGSSPCLGVDSVGPHSGRHRTAQKPPLNRFEEFVEGERQTRLQGLVPGSPTRGDPDPGVRATGHRARLVGDIQRVVFEGEADLAARIRAQPPSSVLVDFGSRRSLSRRDESPMCLRSDAAAVAVDFLELAEFP